MPFRRATALPFLAQAPVGAGQRLRELADLVAPRDRQLRQLMLGADERQRFRHDFATARVTRRAKPQPSASDSSQKTPSASQVSARSMANMRTDAGRRKITRVSSRPGKPTIHSPFGITPDLAVERAFATRRGPAMRPLCRITRPFPGLPEKHLGSDDFPELGGHHFAFAEAACVPENPAFARASSSKARRSSRSRCRSNATTSASEPSSTNTATLDVIQTARLAGRLRVSGLS